MPKKRLMTLTMQVLCSSQHVLIVHTVYDFDNTSHQGKTFDKAKHSSPEKNG